MLCAGHFGKILSLDTILALTLIAMWQPQIVCGLIDLVITGLFMPMSATEVDVVIATLKLILLLAASPTLSLPGYQGARSRILVFCLELMHPLQPAYFLTCISFNAQLQLALLIVLAFQASSEDCCNEMLRCAQHTQWLSRLGVPLPWWLSSVTPELSIFFLQMVSVFCAGIMVSVFCAGIELQNRGPALELPNNAFLALMCLSPLQAATAELLPFVTMPLFAIMVQPDVLADYEVADVLLSAMKAYVGICILDDPLLSPNKTLSKVTHVAL